MERLTVRPPESDEAYLSCERCGKKAISECWDEMDCQQTVLERLAAIEDIMGDDYDLARLRELVEADRDGRCHIGRCVECAHYEGLAVCEYLGDCGGTNWICGWFEPKKSDEAALKGEQDEKMQRPKT